MLQSSDRLPLASHHRRSISVAQYSLGVVSSHASEGGHGANGQVVSKPDDL